MIFFSLGNSITRRHNYKLMKQYSCVDARKLYFSNGVVDRWNCLSYHVVNAHSLNFFKRYLSCLPVSALHWCYWFNSWGTLSLLAGLLCQEFVYLPLGLVLVS